jgi:hypothetical protein
LVHEGGTVPRSSRLRSQDGFIREVLWVALVIAIIALVVLDGMAIFTAHQSVSDDSATAAEEAFNEYAQSFNAPAAKLAAERYLDKSDLEMVQYSAVKMPDGTIKFSVTAKASAHTYAFKLLGVIPQLKDWVERTTHPSGTGTAE